MKLYQSLHVLFVQSDDEIKVVEKSVLEVKVSAENLTGLMPLHLV